MIPTLEESFFLATLPTFLHDTLASNINESTKKMQLGVVENKMYNLAQKYLSRISFLNIYIEQVTKLNQVLLQKVKTKEYQLCDLQNYVSTKIYIWKLRQQINTHLAKEKKEKQTIGMSVDKQLEKYVLKLKLQSCLENPDLPNEIMLDICEEIGSSQRVPQGFQSKFINFLQQLDYTSTKDYLSKMKKRQKLVTARSVSSKSDVSRNQSPILKRQQIKLESYLSKTSAQTLSTPSSTPVSSYSSRLPEAKKFIAKERQITGRTLHMAHPFRHKAKKQVKVKEIIQYVDQKQLQKLEGISSL